MNAGEHLEKVLSGLDSCIAQENEEERFLKELDRRFNDLTKWAIDEASRVVSVEYASDLYNAFVWEGQPGLHRFMEEHGVQPLPTGAVKR